MIIKITGYTDEQPKYFKLCDARNNEIKDEHSQLMITNILKGIQYTMNIIRKDMENLDGYYDIGFFSIQDKIKNYKKILEQIGFCIAFQEVKQEEVTEL